MSLLLFATSGQIEGCKGGAQRLTLYWHEALLILAYAHYAKSFWVTNMKDEQVGCTDLDCWMYCMELLLLL